MKLKLRRETLENLRRFFDLKGEGTKESPIIFDIFGDLCLEISIKMKEMKDKNERNIIKVICCTTTLSAGINVPARVVIVKDFKRYVTSGHNIKNFSGYYENGDGFSYFMPFSANSVFQMLGGASNVDERDWIEDHYFQNAVPVDKI